MRQPPRNTVRLVSREVVQRAPRAHPLLVGTGLLGDIEEKGGRGSDSPQSHEKGTKVPGMGEIM
jgi:hypothetical protein